MLRVPQLLALKLFSAKTYFQSNIIIYKELKQINLKWSARESSHFSEMLNKCPDYKIFFAVTLFSRNININLTKDRSKSIKKRKEKKCSVQGQIQSLNVC